MKDVYSQSPAIALLIVGLPLCILSFCAYAICYLGGEDTTEYEQYHESKLVGGDDGEVKEIPVDEDKMERTAVPGAEGNVLRERKRNED